MFWLRTDKSGIGDFEFGKLLAGISGMAAFALLASVQLWRAGICIPNMKFFAFEVGVPGLALYFAVYVNLVRLRRKLKSVLAQGGGAPATPTGD